MKNNILTEVTRVREIMGIINEQKIKTVVGKEIVEGPMTERLNQLVRRKETKLLNDWKFYITGNEETGPGIKIENKKTGVKSRDFPFTWDANKWRIY